MGAIAKCFFSLALVGCVADTVILPQSDAATDTGADAVALDASVEPDVTPKFDASLCPANLAHTGFLCGTKTSCSGSGACLLTETAIDCSFSSQGATFQCDQSEGHLPSEACVLSGAWTITDGCPVLVNATSFQAWVVLASEPSSLPHLCSTNAGCSSGETCVLAEAHYKSGTAKKTFGICR